MPPIISCTYLLAGQGGPTSRVEQVGRYSRKTCPHCRKLVSRKRGGGKQSEICIELLDALDPDDDEAGDSGETSVEQATREEAALALIEAGGPGVSSAEALLEDAAQADETLDGVEDTPAAPIALLPPHVDPVEKAGGSIEVIEVKPAAEKAAEKKGSARAAKAAKLAPK